MRSASPPRVTVGGTLLGAAAIVVVSAVVGLLVNQLSSRPLPLFARPEPRPPSGSEIISPDAAKARFDARDSLFVDARPASFYESGHIPGAVNLPANDFDLYYPRLADALRRAKAIVIYCDGIECGDTEKLAGLLEKKGFGNLYLFVEGWAAWEQAGYPKAVGAKPNGD